MLISILIMTMSVNGGLYLGTILWSAYKTFEWTRLMDVL